MLLPFYLSRLLQLNDMLIINISLIELPPKHIFCMVKNSIIALLFAFSIFIIAGCEHDANDNPEPERLVKVGYSAVSLSGTSQKSTATAAEDLIESIILFGVDNSGNVVQNYQKLEDGLLSDIQLSIHGKVKWLYAIANPSSEMETADPQTVTDLLNMTIGYSANSPQSPFLMSCIEEVVGNSIELEFIRAIAKIEVVGINGFDVESVSVTTAANGYVFNREASGNMSVPTGTTTYNYDFTSTNPTIYVAENSKQSPLQFVVSGMFDGKLQSCNIILKNGGQNIDVVRNTYYQVRVGFEYED